MVLIAVYARKYEEAKEKTCDLFFHKLSDGFKLGFRAENLVKLLTLVGTCYKSSPQYQNANDPDAEATNCS
jgi:hypothetical protein